MLSIVIPAYNEEKRISNTLISYLDFFKDLKSRGEINDFEITETYIKTLEKIIVDQPELWLWTHHRWKHGKQIQSH